VNDIVMMAEKFAEMKHRGQVDKAGVPYIEHPRAVAGKVLGEKEKVVAWLHDTVEDTGATIDEIRDLFGDEIADAVRVITHERGVPYLEYIKGIRGNELARKVKLADLEHNMDLTRLPVVNDMDLERLEKYKKAVEILTE